MQTLRLFCDVALCRSFSQAAAKHGITQSAASQRVGQLEKRLGVRLFDRSVRPLELTPAGDLLLREGQDLLDHFDDLERRVVEKQKPLAPSEAPPVTGAVRVDAIYSAGIDLLNQVKESFEERHPDVEVTLDYKRPEQVHEAVRAQECDLGIVSYPESWRDVGVIPLRKERMAVVCSPGHELAGHERIHAKELGLWPLLTFEAELPVGRSIRRYLRDHGVHASIKNVFDNIDTIKSALSVATADDLAILPKRTVQREVLAGTLAIVELQPTLERPIGVIYRKRPRKGARNGNGQGGGQGHVGMHVNGPFNAATQAFVDYLVTHAGPKVEAAAGETDGAKSASEAHGLQSVGFRAGGS